MNEAKRGGALAQSVGRVNDIFVIMATRRAAALALPARKRARGPRRRLVPEARREELLAALARVIARDGFLAATVPRVVAEAGVAQGSFYRYFENVDEAFLVLVARTLAPIEQAARQMSFARVKSEDELEAVLLEYYRVLGQQLARQPGLCGAALQLAPALRGPVGEAMRAFFTTMRELAAQWVAPYLDPAPPHAVDPEIVASALVGMVVGASEEALRLGDRFEPDHWAMEMARFEAGALLRLIRRDRAVKPKKRRGR
jgi:AcrR family transcriptional regulator